MIYLVKGLNHDDLRGVKGGDECNPFFCSPFKTGNCLTHCGIVDCTGHVCASFNTEPIV